MAVFTPDGRRLISGPWDGALRVWDVLERRDLPALRSLPVLRPPRHFPAAISPDGAILACVGYETLTLYALADGRRLRILDTDSFWTVTSAAFSPDGAVLAVGLDPEPECYEYLPCLETVVLWDVRTGREIGRLEGEAPEDNRGPSRVRSLAFSPDGAVLAVGPGNGRIKLWDWAGGRMLHTLDELGSAQAVAFSPDGGSLASASGRGGAALWDPTGARKPHRLTLGGEDREAFCVAFSADGALLAAAGEDGSIGLWRTYGGRLVHTLTGQEGQIWDLAFVAGTEILASGCADGAARLWDVTTGREIP